MSEGAIGVFDSGLGGLTVLKELVKLLPDEDYIYLGDNLRMPYGAKTDEEIENFTVAAYKFLREKGIKAMVIACNTATAMGLEGVNRVADIPAVGVISPGADMVAELNKSKIGILATDATVRSKAYDKLILEKMEDAEIFGVGAPDLVLAVESAKTTDEDRRAVVKKYLDQFPEDLEVLVLACTHFPALENFIREYFQERNRVVDIVNPAYETAKVVKSLVGDAASGSGKREYNVTTRPDEFKDIGNVILAGNPVIDQVSTVEIEI